MKLRKLAVVPIAAAAMVFGSAAQAQWSQSFSNTTLGISGVLSDLGSFAGVEKYSLVLDTTQATSAIAGLYLNAVDIKAFSNYDSFTYTASAGSWQDPVGSAGINSGSGNACAAGGNSGFACINAVIPRVAVGSTYTFTFDVSGISGLNTTGINTHVGAGFTDPNGVGNGRILSQVVAVPEPETYAMLLAGLGLMGFVARRRKQNLAA